MAPSKKKAKSTKTGGGGGGGGGEGDGRENSNAVGERPFILLKQVAFIWLALAVVGLAVYLAKLQQEGPPSSSSTAGSQSSKDPSPPTKKHGVSPPSVSPTLTPNTDTTVPTTKDKSNNTSPKKAVPPQETIDESKTWPPPDPRIQRLWDLACSPTNNGGQRDDENTSLLQDEAAATIPQSATCHPALQVVGRSLRVTQPVPTDSVLLEVPRSMQIWDLDAYRDPFIRKYLFKASHTLSGNRLGTEAFLAAYLALEQKRAEENPSHFDPLRLAYLQSLPTHEELQSFHPVLQEKELMTALLGGRSTSYSILQAYRNMVQAEYDAFVAAAPQFQTMIDKQHYFQARVNVMSRVIHVGPPGPEEVMPGNFVGDEFENVDLLQDELYSYNDVLGVKLKGCIALIPIADLLGHHPRSNAQFAYHPRSVISLIGDEAMGTNSTKRKVGRSLIVSTTMESGVDVYREPMVSYGLFSDAHLFARYGFVNGDGSGPTQISIGFNHEILRLNISSPSPSQQYDYVNTNGAGTTTKFRNFHLRGITKYLHYDDGYEQCIPGPATHPAESELKRLKFEYLLKLANDYDRWNMLMPPRNTTASAKSIDTTLTRSVPQYRRHIYSEIEDQIHRLQETCRFMTLINDDFDGRAVEVLKDNMDNSSFVIGPGVSDALEFRSFMCLSRWFGTRVVSMELQGSLPIQFKRLVAMTQSEIGSLNWTAQYVRFAEMDALQLASRLIFERVSKSWEDKKIDPEIEYTMKDDSCPEEFQTYLFRQEDSLSPDLFSVG